MEFLSPGEKVKKLRLELGLKQDDITNEEVSKSLVSMIEQNKRGLTWAVAKILANSFNKHCTLKGEKITAEYLMQTEIEQVQEKIKKGVEHLDSVIESGSFDNIQIQRNINKLVDLANEWELKRELYDLLLLEGKLHYHTYEYKNALMDLTKALEYYIEVKVYEEVARIYNLMGMCNSMLMSMEQALNYYTKAYDTVIEHNTINKSKIKLEAVFNLILCYRKVHRYDMALQFIDIFKELEGDSIQYRNAVHQVFLLEANTYRDLKEFEKAEKVYLKLLEKPHILEKSTLLMIYDNCTILYRQWGNFQKAIEYNDMAFGLKDSVKASYIPWIYLTKAKCKMMLNEVQEAMENLKIGLTMAEQFAKNQMIIDFHFTIAEVCLIQKDHNQALKHIQAGEKIILDNDIKSKKDEINVFYTKVYLALDNKEKCMEYINKMQKDYLAL